MVRLLNFCPSREYKIAFYCGFNLYFPTPEARGGGREDQPHVQGAVAARAQEGLEELSHIEGQEGER